MDPGKSVTKAPSATAQPGPSRDAASKRTGVVLFDGVCNFCNGAVNFIIDRDPAGRFRFAALQSEAAQALLAEKGRTLPPGDPDTVILLETDERGETRLYERSTAALHIAAGLRFPWNLFYALILVPRPVRDFFYRLIAKNRYRWFGKRDACRIPTPELRARFLEMSKPPTATPA
ncbi:MAG: thiol-disulfide oxidoreductase DCC family protein [Polyangia bacterium]